MGDMTRYVEAVQEAFGEDSDLFHSALFLARFAIGACEVEVGSPVEDEVRRLKNEFL